MTRPLCGIFLLVCIATPFTGTYLLLRHHKRVVRREVKQLLAGQVGQKGLKLFKFSTEESRKLNWEKDDEFELGGEMFDVMKSVVSSDSVFYWCWPDHKESVLNRRLRNILDLTLGTDGQNRQTEGRLLNFLKKITLPPLQEWNMQAAEFMLLKSMRWFPSLSTGHLQLPSPPPKF